MANNLTKNKTVYVCSQINISNKMIKKKDNANR